MSDFKEYSEKIENYHKNSLKQADKSFKFASAFGLIGLLFFFLALGATYFAHKQENFTTSSENISKLSTSIADVTDELKSDETKDLSKKLYEISNQLQVVSFDVKKELVGLNKNFIIISLIGGCFIWLIAIINFYQYGKVISQLADRLDRNQRFILANNICEQLKDEDKKDARLTLLKEIAGVNSDNKLKENTPAKAPVASSGSSQSDDPKKPQTTKTT